MMASQSKPVVASNGQGQTSGPDPLARRDEGMPLALEVGFLLCALAFAGIALIGIVATAAHLLGLFP